MTVERLYIISCNECGVVYDSRSDDGQDIEDQAIEDGWVVTEELPTDYHGDIQSTHSCKKCADKK